MSEKAEVSTPTPQEQIQVLLEEFTKRAKAGELANIVIAFTTRQGAADVYSSPMSPVSLCHLSKLLDRRVNAAYDRALRNVDRVKTPGTVGVKANSPQSPAVQVPRKVRRGIARQAINLQKRQAREAARKAKPTTPPIIANTPGKPS